MSKKLRKPKENTCFCTKSFENLRKTNILFPKQCLHYGVLCCWGPDGSRLRLLAEVRVLTTFGRRKRCCAKSLELLCKMVRKHKEIKCVCAQSLENIGKTMFLRKRKIRKPEENTCSQLESQRKACIKKHAKAKLA